MVFPCSVQNVFIKAGKGRLVFPCVQNVFIKAGKGRMVFPCVQNVFIKAGKGRMVFPCAWAEWYLNPICIFPRWYMVSQWRGFRFLLQVYYFTFYWTLTVWDSYKYGIRKWHLSNLICLWFCYKALVLPEPLEIDLLSEMGLNNTAQFLCFMHVYWTI